MSGQGFSFIEKEQKRFISYMLESGDSLVKTELEMLKNNDIPGILPVSEIHDNGSTSLLYNITSRQQFPERMAGVFNGSQLYNMLKSICKMLLLLDEYMVSMEHLVLNMEFIYFEPGNNEVLFTALPIKGRKQDKSIQNLLREIFGNLKYSDSVLMDFPAYIYDYINNNMQVNVKEFNNYIESTYNSLSGIIQPSGEIPEAPVINSNIEKEIIDTEEVKKNVQSRFITQNERIVELEAVEESNSRIKQMQNTGKGDSTLPGITPGSFSVPAPAGAFTTPPAKERKVKEKKPKKAKEKPVKKAKEKPVKEVKEIKEEKEKPVKEKKKDKPKEKKGLFGFGKKNKKENNNEANAVPQPPEKPVIQPVNGMNNSRVPVPPAPFTKPQAAPPPYINSQPQIQPFFNSQIQQGAAQPQYMNGVQGMPVQNQQVNTVPPQPPAWTAMPSAGHPDPDETMILPSGDGGFDSTVLLEPVNNMPKPALRSRVTGEVIKIEYPGFIIGRNRVLNGRIVEMPEGQRPDASINIKSISHTHAVFLWHDSQWYIQDKNSLNGTFVNGGRISGSEEKALNEGDIVCFASEEYEYILVQ